MPLLKHLCRGRGSVLKSASASSVNHGNPVPGDGIRNSVDLAHSCLVLLLKSEKRTFSLNLDQIWA